MMKLTFSKSKLRTFHIKMNLTFIHGIFALNTNRHCSNRFACIRFLDVKKNSIVTFTNVEIKALKYIALSYVWGSSQRLMLTSENENYLAVPGAVNVKALPQTIADALYLADRLDVDYIWVDALCILQDNDEDKKNQIQFMSMIFRASFLTIIAAKRADSDAGLPGLREGTRKFEQQEVVVRPPKYNDGTMVEPGLSLITAITPLKRPALHYLENTVWNSRGWTMQERVLSRRTLAFTDEQLYWVCNRSTFCEESYHETPLPGFHRFHGAAVEMTLHRSYRNFYEPQDPTARFWSQYQNFVARFTRRKFTYDGDAHDGFSAILDAMGRATGQQFLWGLPRARFELGLTWTTFTGQRQRKSLSTLPMTVKNVRVRFPSWSWMGWIGEAWLSVGDDRHEFRHVNSSPLQRVRDILTQRSDLPQVTCHVHRTSPLEIVAVRIESTGDIMSQVLSSFLCNSYSEWKPNHDLLVSLNDIAQHLPSLYERLSSIPDELTLFFWASSALLTLRNDGEDSITIQPTIVDDTGKPIGTMGKMSLEHWNASKYNNQLSELIVIGSRRPTGYNPVLILLHITWRDEIAYRVNIGEIEEAAWMGVQRVWKLIALG
jgi:Heterokaryon incompatibility protein (HET)